MITNELETKTNNNKKKKFTNQAVRTNGPNLWNSLNPDLKNAQSINIFRKKMKTKLISSYN